MCIIIYKLLRFEKSVKIVKWIVQLNGNTNNNSSVSQELKEALSIFTRDWWGDYR